MTNRIPLVDLYESGIAMGWQRLVEVAYRSEIGEKVNAVRSTEIHPACPF